MCKTSLKLFIPIDGAYGIFAGRDASRGLALFRLDKDVIKDEYDDLSDLEPSEMDGVREWEMQFMGMTCLYCSCESGFGTFL